MKRTVNAAKATTSRNSTISVIETEVLAPDLSVQTVYVITDMKIEGQVSS